MMRRLPWAYWLCLAALAGILTGCGKNIITTESLDDKSNPVKTTQELTDEAANYQAQVRLAELIKPTLELEIPTGSNLVLPGGTRLKVHGHQAGPLQSYNPAWARVLINGMPLAAMVLNGAITADMANKVVSAVGAQVGTKIYNIRTNDGGPVQIAGGNINGTLTIQQPKTTSTDDHSTGGAQ